MVRHIRPPAGYNSFVHGRYTAPEQCFPACLFAETLLYSLYVVSCFSHYKTETERTFRKGKREGAVDVRDYISVGGTVSLFEW